jgi:hypothetical protein
MNVRYTDPSRYRHHVLSSWRLIAAVLDRIGDESFVAHLQPHEGVGYDCLSLVTREQGRGVAVRFMLNRNGQNARAMGTIVNDIWRRVDDDGVEPVIEELIGASRLSLVGATSGSHTSLLSRQVVDWIERHADQEFSVSPPDWPGGCSTLLDIPVVRGQSDHWPIADHGPQLSLGVASMEVERWSFVESQ